MLNELKNIETLLESFLGKSKNGMSDDTQIQFNCPMCSIEKGCMMEMENIIWK